MSSEAATRTANGVLATLSTADRQATLLHSTHETYALGAVLLSAGHRSESAFFPTTCVISLVRTLNDGATIEVGLIGNEGVAGIDIVLDAETQPNDVIVQGAGSAWRIPASDLRTLFSELPTLHTALLRFTNTFITQIAQTVACNRLHPVEQRLARWLLMMDDRVGDGGVRLTQGYVSKMLGARTASVNEAVQSLEAAGAIAHRRQLLTIIDRTRLERIACECYETVRRLTPSNA
ncbi:MAG: Crp/Fnr family transcriptional regulator [Thermoanaerobaculia bacterium]